MLAAGGAAYAFLHASLPTLDGTLATPGLASSVTITRDAAGVPTLRAANRTDLAYAIGFAHAQDRFFQMDLLRRAGSGELAGLLGPRLLPVDRERRIHRFAARATAAVAAMSADDKVLLDRYVSGVNAGLASLGARPFEYAVLRTTPRPWRPEDTLLVIWTMYFDLQDDQLHRVYSRGWLRDHGTSPEQLAFLLPTSTGYDAPLDAPRIDEPAPALPASAPAWFGKPAVGSKVATAANLAPQADLLPPADTVFGSNNWAVSGARSATGAAIVSVDMHLALRLPHIWHRAVIEITAPPGGVPAARRLAGVMLPGAPAIVAGSNGRVAWGFTNSYGHYLELLELERDPQDATRYRTASGWAPFKYTDERIEVAGAATETLSVAETLWGPVWERGGKSYAVRWVAHDPGAVDFKLGEIDAVTTVAEALALGQRSGVPAQNMVAGDSAGHIGWTVAGAIPGRASTWLATLPLPGRLGFGPGLGRAGGAGLTSDHHRSAGAAAVDGQCAPARRPRLRAHRRWRRRPRRACPAGPRRRHCPRRPHRRGRPLRRCPRRPRPLPHPLAGACAEGAGRQRQRFRPPAAGRVRPPAANDLERTRLDRFGGLPPDPQLLQRALSAALRQRR